MTTEELTQSLDSLSAMIKAYMQAHPGEEMSAEVLEVVEEAQEYAQKACDAILPPQNPEQSRAHEEALGHLPNDATVQEQPQFHTTPPEPAKE